MQAKAIDEKLTDFLRADLQELLLHSQIDTYKLSNFQRVILTTDGTLTEILEAYLFEKIQVVKLSETKVVIEEDILPLDIKEGSEVIERRIVLQGKRSRNNWIYAESIIVPDRLDEEFRERLLISQEPIGKLWLQHRVETFKEIVALKREVAEHLVDYFNIQKEDKLLSRTYRVFSNRKPIMMITEKFPENYFCDVARPQHIDNVNNSGGEL